jgi:hypothetical protein
MKYLITESSRFKSLKIIKEIREIVSSIDDAVVMDELVGETGAPTIENPDPDNESHMVSTLFLDEVEAIVYYHDGSDNDYYTLSYEELELNVLEEILEILKEGL